jgi:hypothetical protein
MAIKKYVAISYCCAFLFVYFSSIAYALLSTSMNNAWDISLPQTTAMNASASAISSFSSVPGTLAVVGVIVLVIALFFIIESTRAMGAAI